MKKILIAVSQLRVGGISKALVELLKNIKEKYDVTLLCFDHEGAFFEDIPQDIDMIEDNPFLVLTERSAEDLHQYGSRYKILRQICSAWTKGFNKRLPAKYICYRVGKIGGFYDVAIAFGHPQQENLFCNLAGEIVLNCVDAKKKAIVIHCDYEMYGGHCKYNDELLMKFDKIAAVSRSVGDAVVRCVPEAASKICQLRNFHDFKSITEQANDDPVIYTHDYVLVTVARLSAEKGILQALDVIEKIHEKGYDVEWHIVGGGPLEKEIEHKISEMMAEKYVFLEGETKNPYRYIKNADYLFVPSIHEAAPMVFDEAARLKVPVISSNTLSAKELVSDRSIGLVGDLDQLEDITEQALIRKEHYRNKITEFVSSNRGAMQDFEKLCGN